ncbi:MAG: PH domain-containing protein [Gemmatimonadota bacterium]
MNAPEDREGWRRLHPVTPLLRSVQLLYAFVIGAFVARFGGPTVVVLLVAIAAFAAWITIGYLRFRYQVTEDSLIIHHGVLFRQRRVIPRSRIQNVDLRAGLIQQILGVATARVETAGGQGTEATLHVVSRAEGERLRDTFVALPGGRAAPMALDMAVPETVVHRATVLDLVIAGATSNRAGLLVAALLGGDYFLDFMPTDWLLGRFIPPELMAPEAAVNSLVQTAQHNIRAFIVGLSALTLFFVLAGWGLSVLASVMRFFDFRLAQTGGELRVSYGLFTRREKGFRRSRVQNVQVEEPILRRWLGLASLRVQTAGYGPGVKADERVETLAPIARTGEIPDYLTMVFPDFEWESVVWRASHPRARRRLFIRRALVVVLVSTLLAVFVEPRALVLLVALLPAWLLAAAHYRHLGHARAGGYVLTREGLWNRRTYIVPVRKIQALHLKQSPFQRRLGLGTVTIETAGNPYEWHAPRSLDVGQAYGVDMMESLASDVTGTGLVF